MGDAARILALLPAYRRAEIRIAHIDGVCPPNITDFGVFSNRDLWHIYCLSINQTLFMGTDAMD